MAVTKDQSLLIANEGRPQLFAILQESKKCGLQEFGKLVRGGFIEDAARDTATIHQRKPRDPLRKDCASLRLKNISELARFSSKGAGSLAGDRMLTNN